MLTCRRALLQGLLSLAAAQALAQQVLAQGPAQGPRPAPPSPPQPNPFRFDDVVRRARDLAAAPFDPGVPSLPEPLAKLDFDAYRDLRFRPDKALATGAGSPFRLHLFHLGFLYQRPVTVNVIRDGVATPVPYQAQLFDFGRTRIERPLPVNLGFAGFRLHYPLNSPQVLDEVIAFLGASYFRFLGRGQSYGLSARGLAVNVEGREAEEFPVFREFWIETPPADQERVLVHALLDSAAVTGAYRFEIVPGPDTLVEVGATLFPRRRLTGLGIAPLTSMFFTGESERRPVDDFRREVHDSDGLLMQTGTGEWLWRPLRNPAQKSVSMFQDTHPRGFGLMQRDRRFESYQDLEAQYHRRPSYWVEPVGAWGEGHVELVEIPTGDETKDNIVVYWEPRRAYEPGEVVTLAYRIRALGNAEPHARGKAVNTFQTPPKASGSSDPGDPTARRFIIDFAEGDLDYYLSDPGQVQLVPSTSVGRITHSFVVPNEPIRGFRAAFDVKLEPGQSADLRAYLRAGNKALTETWTLPWAPA